jgi:hypothetical protein
VVFDVCAEHHSWITRAQSHAARKQHFPLTEKQRWLFWFRLKTGEMKRPRNTHVDREWADSGREVSMTLDEQPIKEIEVPVETRPAKGARKEPRESGATRLTRKKRTDGSRRRSSRRTS